MTVIYPEGTPTLGNTKVKAAVAVADLEAPKLATEINAASSVDLTCFLYPAGWNPSATQAKGTKPARLCTTTQSESLNRTTWTLPALQYVYDPQADDETDENKAKALLTEGTEIFIVERMGLDGQDAAFAVGQRTRTHHIRVGTQVPSGDRTDENGEFFIMQEAVYVVDPVVGVIAA